MATIRIHDLRLRAIIGINDWEREALQDIVLNIAFDFDETKAAQSDDLADTIDYKSLKKRIIRLVEASRYNLIEKLGTEVLNLIMEEPKITSAQIRLDKPLALRFAKSVSIELKKSRS